MAFEPQHQYSNPSVQYGARADIPILEKKIKNKAILLFVLAGFGLLITLLDSASVLGLFNFLVLFDIGLFSMFIVAGVLVTKLNKTGFVLALVLLAITTLIQIYMLIQVGAYVPIIIGFIVRAFIIWAMIDGLKKCDQLQDLKRAFQNPF